MNIVVLDSYGETQGDISLDWLKRYGSVNIYTRTKPDELYERVKNADVIFSNKVCINRSMIESLPKLIYIGLFSTGFNVIDIKAADEHGITVTNVPDYSTNAVAQMVFALILEHTNLVGLHNESVKSGEWSRCPDFFYFKSPLTELYGKSIGLIGFGRIGKRVAAIATSFGMDVNVYTPHPDKSFESSSLRFFGDLYSMLEQSDVVSLHCPLTGRTERLVNKKFLSHMKNTALLINTSRGAVVDEEALAEALTKNEIRGAGLDVMCTEPPAPDSRLFGCKNCIITPHISWAALETRQRLVNVVRENFEAFLNGHPQNTVNGRA